MRSRASSVENLIRAYKAKDKELYRKFLVNDIVLMIEDNPKLLIKAMRESNIKVSDNPSRKELIDKSAYSLFNNRIFVKNLLHKIVLLDSNNHQSRQEFLGLAGGGEAGSFFDDIGQSLSGMFSSGAESGAESGAGGGGAAGIVDSLASLTDSIFGFATSKNELKAEEERAKAEMFNSVMNQNKKKTNWMPVVVVGGVLLIGGLIAWRVVGNKK
jgi:hypothetical protein